MKKLNIRRSLTLLLPLLVLLFSALTVSAQTASGETNPLTLNTYSKTIGLGRGCTLTATLSPEAEGASQTVRWSSSDSSVATVSTYGGQVTSKGVGRCTITAKCGTYSATCNLTVKEYPLTAISLSKTELIIDKGKSATIKVSSYTPSNTTDSKTVTWKSSNTAVATVSGGKITARGLGTCTITAKCGKRTATCKVTCVPVGSLHAITLSKTSVTIGRGRKNTLTVGYDPVNTTASKTVSWSSSDTRVATVSGGVITGKTPGTCTITAKCGTRRAVCRVTVKEYPLQSISMKTSLTVEKGRTAKLSVTYTPTNTTSSKTITWRSSNTSVATVSNGTVTAKAAGTCTITAKCGTKTATCKVTVRPVGYVESISLDRTSMTLGLGRGYLLTLSYNPARSAAYHTATWTSSDTRVATVSGGQVTTRSEGTCTITAKVGSKTATCRVTVKRYPLQSISLGTDDTVLKIGQTAKLKVTYTPSNTTDSKTVTWSSSNSKIASVSGGTVTAKGQGTCIITAKCGSFTAKHIVTVTESSYWDVSDAYTLLNAFRTDSKNQWYWNEDNKTKTRTPGLPALIRDSELEAVARVRAKEQWTQYYVNGKATHTRPNGSSCWTAYPSGSNYCGEDLGWGHRSATSIINGWAETDKPYLEQGHRRSILSSVPKRVGIACYEKDGKTCWAMCLGY